MRTFAGENARRTFFESMAGANNKGGLEMKRNHKKVEIMALYIAKF